jgi:hypothetical protein
MTVRTSAKLEIFTVLKFVYLQEERLRNSEQLKYSEVGQPVHHASSCSLQFQVRRHY